MARIKKYSDPKKDEDCQYGFDGQPLKGTKRLRKKSDHDTVSAWI